MNRKIPLGLTIALMAIAAAITFIISTSYSMSIFNKLVADVQQRAEMYQKLEQIDAYVRQYYDGTIDEDKLIEALANGYISIIEDADARYLTAREYSLYREAQSGTHIGIGVYTYEDGGYPAVRQVLSNSPASAAGISVGESIVEINGQSALDLGYDAAESLLRSNSGTQLELTVRSSGEDRTVIVSTTQMNIATVESTLYGNVGRLKISGFSEKTFQQFSSAYSSFSSQGIKGLIIDLRNNDSELFDPAINILSAILPSGSNTAIKIDRSGAESVYEKAAGSMTINLPICVIVNSRTSGPAELFAAALKDYLGASVVGAGTSGSADLFESYPLYDGTAIVLPTATLRTDNIEISGVGIKPDYEAATAFDDTDEQLALLNENDDPALKRALEIVTSLIPAE